MARTVPPSVTAIAALGVPCQFHPALPPPEFGGHATDFFAEQVRAPARPHPKNRYSTPHPPEFRRNPSVFRQPAKELAACLLCPTCGRVTAQSGVDCGAGRRASGCDTLRNLADLAGWIGGARLYIGNDSGITHLAAAMGLPVRSRCSVRRNPAEVWAPRGENVTVLRCDPMTNCRLKRVLDSR